METHRRSGLSEGSDPSNVARIPRAEGSAEPYLPNSLLIYSILAFSLLRDISWKFPFLGDTLTPAGRLF